MSANFRARAWIFTINNHLFSDMMYIMDLPYRYFCFGFETCPKTGTPHIQGYVYFHNAHTRKSVSKMLPRARVALAKGTTQENDIYTSKVDGDDWYSDGDPPHQGEAKWEQITEVMKDPRMQPQVANQYRKLYRELTYCKLKDHKRNLVFHPYNDRYELGRTYPPGKFLLYKPHHLIGTPEYNDQDAICLDRDYDPWFPIQDWFNGFPPTTTRGYELITIDPETVYILYQNEEQLTVLMEEYPYYTHIN